MWKIKKINGYLVVKFNDREKRENEGTGLGEYGVIDAELYTGHLDIDRDAMEYDDAGTLEEAVELARGLDSEMDITEPPTTYTISAESDGSYTEETVDPQILINGWEHQLEAQIEATSRPDIDTRTAAHELHGFKAALNRLGMLEGEDTPVDPRHFGPLPEEKPCCSFQDDGYESVGILAGDELAEFTPHDYQEVETIGNCTVQTLRCRRCGHESFAWSRSAPPRDKEGSEGRLIEPGEDLQCAAEVEGCFGNLPEKHYNRPIYRLGLLLEKDCPDNDCQIFLYIFRAAKEIDNSLILVEGIPRDILQRELRKRFREMEEMFRFNHAVTKYRKEVQA